MKKFLPMDLQILVGFKMVDGIQKHLPIDGLSGFSMTSFPGSDTLWLCD